MKRILVGVDGSECGLKALRMAAQLAGPIEAEVTVAYAIAPRAYPEALTLSPQVVAGLVEADHALGLKILGDAVAAIRKECPTVKAELLVGPPPLALADLAEAQGFDLVAVGCRGMGLVKRVLVGSTSYRLVHVCKRPVLVVH